MKNQKDWNVTYCKRFAGLQTVYHGQNTFDRSAVAGNFLLCEMPLIWKS